MRVVEIAGQRLCRAMARVSGMKAVAATRVVVPRVNPLRRAVGIAGQRPHRAMALVSGLKAHARARGAAPRAKAIMTPVETVAPGQ